MTNLSSPHIRWRVTNRMAEHDRLPAPLRAWLAKAALPWSAQSAQRLWQKAMQQTQCPDAALQHLQRAETKTLAREAARVWGPNYPTGA